MTPRLSYEAALEMVMGLADFERSSHSPGHARFHLERMGLLAERLGSPHLQVPTVHIAGTKGKGSTAAMVTSILTAEGYRVGLYTSPHLHSVVERIRVGLEAITQDEFAGLVECVWPAVESAGRDGGYGDVTTFEMLTAMGFQHFQAVGADVQVIEVGLGGRLDSTNIVDPEVSVITSISLDHVVTLGSTLERIASEKAGIIKSGAPVVVAPQPEQALAVFREVARERGAPLVDVEATVAWERRDVDHSGQWATLRGPRDHYDVHLPLLGDHQLENAATAVTAVETLADRGFRISKDSVVTGIREVKWPARLEVLSRAGPLVVVDGAHNPYSMRRLVQAVRDYFRFDRVVLIFGGLGGHSAHGMAAELAELSPAVVAVRSRHPRSVSSDVVAGVASDGGLTVVFQSDDVGEGTRRALEIAGENDLVLATGSLSVAAEVIEEIKGVPAEVYPNIKRPADQDSAVVV
ncbi:MAG: bifunctional folylpolyglutamate synthase/dihydrofolate synthase [Chloroflexi bacterium]|nr:bifunctional folylpolyglutamate synthase/dihydrofolate synthase [Chloroflexota bacterium]